MAKECEISSKMDLTIDEAVRERLELIEYRKSENWTYPVIEKIDRRIADLNNLIAEIITEGFESRMTFIAIKDMNFIKIKEFLDGLNS